MAIQSSVTGVEHFSSTHHSSRMDHTTNERIAVSAAETPVSVRQEAKRRASAEGAPGVPALIVQPTPPKAPSFSTPAQTRETARKPLPQQNGPSPRDKEMSSALVKPAVGKSNERITRKGAKEKGGRKKHGKK